VNEPAWLFQAFAQAALPAYGLDGAQVRLLNVSENGTFRVDHPQQGPSVLRVHRSGYHSEPAIRSELAWIEALRAEGVVRTPAFLPTLDRSPVARVELPDGQSRHVVRFTWVDGTEPDETRLTRDFAELGEITARLHRHARSWRRPAGFTRFVWDYDTSLGEKGHWGRWQDGLGVGPAELAVLGRLDEALRARLAEYGQGESRFGLVHADMRLANLLVDGDTVTVIDFDDCGFSWFMYDFASAVSFIEHESYVPELAEAWVGGYRSVTEPSASDVAELPTFVMLRRLLLVAWIGSHRSTETAQAMGPQYTAVSCELAERYLSGRLFG